MRTLADTMTGIMLGSISHQEYNHTLVHYGPYFISLGIAEFGTVYINPLASFLQANIRQALEAGSYLYLDDWCHGSRYGGGCSSSNIADSRSTTPQWCRPGEAVVPKGSRKDSHIYRASTYWLKRGTGCSSFILEGNTLRSISFSPSDRRHLFPVHH